MSRAALSLSLVFAATPAMGWCAQQAPAPSPMPMPMPMTMPPAQSSPAAPPAPAASEAPDLLQHAEARPALPLSFFLSRAVTGHPALAAQQQQVAATLAQAHQAGLAPSPELGYSGEHIRGGLYGGGEQGGFVEQQFVLGGKLGLRRDALRSQASEESAGVDEKRLSKQGQVSLLFYAALATQAEIAIRQAQLQLAMDAEDTAHQEANLGELDRPAVLQSQLNTETARLDYARAQQEYLVRWNALLAATGIGSLPLAPLAGQLTQPPHLDAQAELERAMATSPSVLRARQAVAAAQAQLRATAQEAVPDLRVKAGEWWSGEQSPTGRAAGPMSFAELALPLPLWNRNQGATDAARAEVSRQTSLLAAEELAVRGTLATVANRYNGASWEAGRLRDQLLPQAEEAVQQANRGYNSMQSSYGPVLQARDRALALQLRYLRALADQWSAALTLLNFTPEVAASTSE